MITVAKFGGTSVKDDIAFKRLAEIIKSKSSKSIVVVSAMAGITDELIAVIKFIEAGNLKKAVVVLNNIFLKHEQLVANLELSRKTKNLIEEKRDELIRLVGALNVLGEISPKSYDMILSTGELLSSFILAEYFKSINKEAKYIDSRDIIKTNSMFTEAEVNFSATEKLIKKKLKQALIKHDTVVCGGFIASDSKGNTTTLGRGGSDYSAAIIAAGINASSLEIWTDVSGIMTSDPRLIKESRIIKELTYTEASELAYFGAKVLHPKTIQPAVKNNIPVLVRNSYEPKHPGTKIVERSKHNKILKAIAFRKKITVINVSSNRMLGAHGFLERVFEVFKKYETSVDIITTSEVSISLTIDSDKNLSMIRTELKKIADIEIKRNYGIICAVGEGIRDTAGMAARFFGALKGINILMVSIGASDVNISIVLNEKDVEPSVKLLHDEFFGGDLNNRIFY